MNPRVKKLVYGFSLFSLLSFCFLQFATIQLLASEKESTSEQTVHKTNAVAYGIESVAAALFTFFGGDQ